MEDLHPFTNSKKNNRFLFFREVCPRLSSIKRSGKSKVSFICSDCDMAAECKERQLNAHVLHLTKFGLHKEKLSCIRCMNRACFRFSNFWIIKPQTLSFLQSEKEMLTTFKVTCNLHGNQHGLLWGTAKPQVSHHVCQTWANKGEISQNESTLIFMCTHSWCGQVPTRSVI